MKKSCKSIKKLAKQTFEKYSISKVSPEKIKEVISAQGYTVIRYSLTDPSYETKRLMETLGVLQYASFHDSFTYSGLSKKIVFIRSDISESEYFYLLLFELGRILTYTEKTDNLIGVTALEQAMASEFAYHITDCANHGIIYNSFKFHPVKGTLIFTSVIAAITVITGMIAGEKIMGSTQIYLDNPDTSYSSDLSETQDSSKASDSSSEFDSSSVQNEDADSEAGEVGFVLPEDERVYYATKSGEKYHIAGCSYISGRETVELSFDDINSGNYSPCSRCFP